MQKKYNEDKDYIETTTTLGNKTYHQTKLNKAKAKLALLNKNKNPNFHKNAQVKRAKQEQKGEIKKAAKTLKSIKSKWSINAATIEQLSKIAKNKQNNKRAALLPPTVTKLTKVPIIVSHSGSAYKAAKKRFQALSTGNIKEYMRSHEGFV